MSRRKNESLCSFPIYFHFSLVVSCVVNKRQNLYFSLQLFLLLLLLLWFGFFFSFWNCVYVYLLHEHQWAHWFIFTFCLTLTLLIAYFFFRCCSLAFYFVTIVAVVCQRVDITQAEPGRQVGFNLYFFFIRKGGLLKLTFIFNFSVLFTSAKIFFCFVFVLKWPLISFFNAVKEREGFFFSQHSTCSLSR